MNGLCNDVGENRIAVPVESFCPSRWFFWIESKASWVFDNSMTVTCSGNFSGF